MKNFLLSALFFFSVIGCINAQISYSGCTGVITAPYPFTLSFSGTVDDGGTVRNTYTSPTPGPDCGAGICSYRIIWNTLADRWELRLSNNGGVSYDFLLYFNTAASVPNPPDLSLGTWQDQGMCGGEPIGTLSGDVQSDLVLPVELTKFEGREAKNIISLVWLTASELNNDYFSIQKSIDGKNFEEIGIEKGAGTISATQTYTFEDRYPVNGVNYYRLVQVDFDGNKSFSDVISINYKKEEAISVFPNPAKHELFVLGMETWSSDVTIHIFNNNGQLMQQQSANGHDHKVAVNIEALNTGIYTIQVVSENQTYTQRFVKQ